MPFPLFRRRAADALGRLGGPQSLWVCGITFGTLVAMKFYFDRTISGKAMLAVPATGRRPR